MFLPGLAIRRRANECRQIIALQFPIAFRRDEVRNHAFHCYIALVATNLREGRTVVDATRRLVPTKGDSWPPNIVGASLALEQDASQLSPLGDVFSALVATSSSCEATKDGLRGRLISDDWHASIISTASCRGACAHGASQNRSNAE